MKKVELNCNDIVIADIITKQDYVQNKIKYDAKYFIKELYHKIFLLEKNNKSKIVFSSYLFAIKEKLGLSKGVVLVADFQNNKNIFLLGTLDNPLDSKSLLKIEYSLDKFYENNILTFSNWVKFFASPDKSIHVITNSSASFKEIISEQNLDNYKFKFLKKEDVFKINSSIKPVYVKEDLIKIYIPPFAFLIILYFVISSISDTIIANDLENSKNINQNKIQELSLKTQELDSLKNADYYKNKEYYLRLSERKVYTKAQND